MPFTESTLLPSQDALLQRLLHLSTYGQQLMVLTGEGGAGKTTLVTALLSELEQHSSALVMCPKHCDSAEIRRKVLVQLLNDPVFDDEIPLPECLLSVSASLPSESCIVLDDAHWLPLEIWAECIVLSQMVLPGKSIKLLMTAPAEFFSELTEQLPESLLEQVVAVQIEPLEQPEREGLYYTLLSRSEQHPFTPRDIVKNRLEMQLGTPKEVVDLLDLSLNGESEALVKKSKLKVIIGLSAVIIIALLLSWLFLGSSTDKLSQATHKVEFAADVEARFSQGDRFLEAYGAKVLGKHVFIKPNAAKQTEIDNRQIQAQAQTAQSDTAIETVNTYTAVPATTFDDVNRVIDATSKFDNVNEHQPDLTEQFASEIAVDVNVVNHAIKPSKGYTLQLASVKKIKSLNNMLQALDGVPQVQVARYKQRWIVLNGHFDNRKMAQEYSAQLVANTGISEPWIREWQNLGEYQLQEVIPTREIQ
ncbi:AAA family ATPase [Shewanella pneumatophori]|uniref:AAA family ATPase n=1 Tax=Shewanella pneumatophori TaxID=314092 RepID=A0A9X1ZE62_9GAMM|nr:AAA family ATPase [Shewanella pneumatophori]MCL1140639.1 AAA family ATPase [Shewanella pneumatophori]